MAEEPSTPSTRPPRRFLCFCPVLRLMRRWRRGPLALYIVALANGVPQWKLRSLRRHAVVGRDTIRRAERRERGEMDI